MPNISNSDMIAISKREMRTEAKLDKALKEIERLKEVIKKLKAGDETIPTRNKISK